MFRTKFKLSADRIQFLEVITGYVTGINCLWNRTYTMGSTTNTEPKTSESRLKPVQSLRGSTAITNILDTEKC